MFAVAETEQPNIATGHRKRLRGKAMDDYEIRITRSDCTPVYVACRQVSDHAAVRRAHASSEEGDEVEIWRGDMCVYARLYYRAGCWSNLELLRRRHSLNTAVDVRTGASQSSDDIAIAGGSGARD